MLKLCTVAIVLLASCLSLSHGANNDSIIEGNTIAPHHWQQKGSQPIALPIYDATLDPKWAPLVQTAISQWQAASTAFALSYTAKDRTTLPSILSGPVYASYILDFPTLQTVSYTQIETKGQFITGTAAAIDNSSFTVAALGGDPVYAAQESRRIVLHEMGHALGLDHNEDANGVLQPSVMGSGLYITDWERTQLCTIYHCR